MFFFHQIKLCISTHKLTKLMIFNLILQDKNEPSIQKYRSCFWCCWLKLMSKLQKSLKKSGFVLFDLNLVMHWNITQKCRSKNNINIYLAVNNRNFELNPLRQQLHSVRQQLRSVRQQLRSVRQQLHSVQQQLHRVQRQLQLQVSNYHLDFFTPNKMYFRKNHHFQPNTQQKKQYNNNYVLLNLYYNFSVQNW